MENDCYFQTICSEIPFSELERRVLIYIAEAEIQMGSDFDIRGNKYVVDMVVKDFKHLPLYAVEGAFKKGSLGQYGAGKLVPRTIYGWLAEMSTSHYNRSRNIADTIEVKKWDGLLNCPLGSAICRKIDMYNNGMLSIDGKTPPGVIPADKIIDWDTISLKNIAESIVGEKL